MAFPPMAAWGYQDSVGLTGVKGTPADGEIVIPAIVYARLPED